MYGLGGYGGGYGGYSGGYGSSYGGGYGGYSSSYGGLDSNRSYLSQNRSKLSAEANTKQGPDGKKVPLTQQQKKIEQQASGRKVVFQQWFKMMGGLRSILELGFAAIALTNFCTTTADLLKKFGQYSKQTSISAAKYIQSKFPTKIFSKLASPKHRGKVVKKMMIVMFRLFALILLGFGIKLRRQIKNESQKKESQMMQKFQKLKQSQIQMEDQRQIEGRRLEAQQNGNHDANL